jgi:glutaredoxin
MMKKLFALSVLVLFAVLFNSRAVGFVSAQAAVTVHLFHSEGCPHCRDERAFLEEIAPRYPDVEFALYEISKDASAAKLLGKVGEALKTTIPGVPFTVIGDQFVVGFGSSETTGVQIERLIEQQQQSQRPDIVKALQFESTTNKTTATTPTIVEAENPEEATQEDGSTVDPTLNVLDTSISVPVVGNISIRSLSLPTLTVLIAFLDGFNPCAMWVLIFLISLLIGMHDRKRMWILGSTFIVASGLVYLLFMTAWLNFFLLLGYIQLTRTLIGLFALGVGIYQLRDFYVNKDGGCKVVPSEKRRPWLERMKKVVGQKQLVFAMAGMVGLAAAVNVVELACSAGLPAIYTQVLAVSGLATWQHYVLLLLYIIIFMIDDILIFVIAMKTLQITGIQHKYARYSHLIGGIVIFLLGILLVFKPEWLLFG